MNDDTSNSRKRARLTDNTTTTQQTMSPCRGVEHLLSPHIHVQSIKWLMESVPRWRGVHVVASPATLQTLQDRDVCQTMDTSRRAWNYFGSVHSLLGLLHLIHATLYTDVCIAVCGATGSGKTVSSVCAAGSFTPDKWLVNHVTVVHRLCFYVTAAELGIEDQLDGSHNDQEAVLDAIRKQMEQHTTVPLKRLIGNLGPQERLVLTVVVDDAGECEKITAAISELGPITLLCKIAPNARIDFLFEHCEGRFIVAGSGIKTQCRTNGSMPSRFCQLYLGPDTAYDIFLDSTKTTKEFVEQLTPMQRQSLQNRRMAALVAENLKELSDSAAQLTELPSHVVQSAFVLSAVHFKNKHPMMKLLAQSGVHDVLWRALQVAAFHRPFVGTPKLWELERQFGLLDDKGRWLDSYLASVAPAPGDCELVCTDYRTPSQQFVAPLQYRYHFPPPLYAVLMMFVYGDWAEQYSTIELATQTAMVTLLMMCVNQPLSALFAYIDGDQQPAPASTGELCAGSSVVVGSLNAVRPHLSDPNTICVFSVPRNPVIDSPFADLVVLVGSTALLIQCRPPDKGGKALTKVEVSEALDAMGRTGWSKAEAVAALHAAIAMKSPDTSDEQLTASCMAMHPSMILLCAHLEIEPGELRAITQVHYVFAEREATKTTDNAPPKKKRKNKPELDVHCFHYNSFAAQFGGLLPPLESASGKKPLTIERMKSSTR